MTSDDGGVVGCAQRHLQADGARGRRVDGEARLGQSLRHESGDGRVVFDDEYAQGRTSRLGAGYPLTARLLSLPISVRSPRSRWRPRVP